MRKDVLVAHIEHMHQRFNEVPEFFLYAHSCQGIAFGDSLRSGDTPRLEATPDTRGSLQLPKSTSRLFYRGEADFSHSEIVKLQVAGTHL